MRPGGERTRPKPGTLLADMYERCSQLWILAPLRRTCRARRRSGNSESGEKGKRRGGRGRAGCRGREQPFSLPVPSFMTSA